MYTCTVSVLQQVIVQCVQCVKLTVATSPMATENYPLATYFVLPGAVILGDQLPQPAIRWARRTHIDCNTCG